MIDLEDDIFQAHCQLDYLRDYIEDGGRIAHVRDDIVTIDLPGNTFTEVNLRPIQFLLGELRKMEGVK